MKTRTTLAVASLVVLGGLGTAAGVASAQDDPTPPSSTPAHPKAEFACANLAQIQRVQADHATLITDRLALLASARSAADEAGRTKAVARIDQRTATLTERQQEVAQRQQEVADFAAAHCGATGG